MFASDVPPKGQTEMNLVKCHRFQTWLKMGIKKRDLAVREDRQSGKTEAHFEAVYLNVILGHTHLACSARQKHTLVPPADRTSGV